MTPEQIKSVATEAGIDEWWDSGSDWRETFDAVLLKFANAIEAHTRAELLDEIRELKAKLEEMTDNNLDKIMEMSDEQIRALSAFEGHNPDDDAKIAKQAAEIAILKHKLSEKKA